MTHLFNHLRQAVWQALAHDVMNTAKAAAYSGMLMLFPALLVFTTLLAQMTEKATPIREIRTVFEQLLPADTMDMLQSYIFSRPIHSTQVILSATGLAVFASLGLMLSLMEGFRRAYQGPREEWGFWPRRFRALLLVPIVLVPLSLATLLLIFGRQIEGWMIDNTGHKMRLLVLVIWRLSRWMIALATSVTVLGALYHFGTKRKEHWLLVAPGAIASTLLWFPATLAFGWYVTRVANYSRFYGPFGAGIATLVWLYLTSFSALMGAELNGVLYRERQALISASGGSHSDSSRM